MKTLSFKHSSSVRAVILVAAMFLLGGVQVFAQSLGGGEGALLLNEAAQTMGSLVDGVVRIIQIAMALGALITLALAIFNVMKGEREAAQKLGYWVIGLALGFALISVVSNLIR